MENIHGSVNRILFRNEENGYTVATIDCDDGELTVVGIMPGLSEGLFADFNGEMVEHASYGEQFKVSTYSEREPEDAESIERYLAGGAIKGVGPALAARIVKKFGDETFRIIDEEPERLAEIRGISERKAMEIAQNAEEKRSVRRAMTFLQKYSISMNLSVKIYEFYGDRLYDIMKNNPYRLAEDIKGVGFKIADNIAMSAGIPPYSGERVKCGILYCLSEASAEGHTYLPYGLLKGRAASLMNVSEELAEHGIMELSVDRRIIVKKTAETKQVFLAGVYKVESSSAYMLNCLNVDRKPDPKSVEVIISEIMKNTDIELAEKQKEAIRLAASKGVLVITGGPGTGKTTTLNSIIEYLEIEGREYALCAPTGRAAKRMKETTGREASTIHRLLEQTGGVEDDEVFMGRDEDNPLDAEYVIVDEMSMVDIFLMNSLLRAVRSGTSLILVGDVDQLPSVGPGTVLSDIIASGMFTVVELNEIFRQAGESDIVVNAHKINKGEHIVCDNKSNDFFFLERGDTETVTRVVMDLITRKLPPQFGCDPFDIQVLVPTRKGALGVEMLNTRLQEVLNPPDPSKAECLRFAGGVFREGDKVMQIKNNYQLEWEVRGRLNIAMDCGMGVFNGDVGIIRIIDNFMETMTVEFDDGHLVEYPLKLTEELELAYAVTIHKSQGSEYPVVVIPLLRGPSVLLNRNLLYTAVTRAKKCVTIVGSRAVFDDMIENDRQDKRYCAFRDRLRETGDI